LAGFLTRDDFGAVARALRFSGSCFFGGVAIMFRTMASRRLAVSLAE